jgi:hypothetical protein
VATTTTLVGLAAFARDGNRLCASGGALDRSLSQAGQAVLEPIAAQVRSAYPRGKTGRLAGSVKVAGVPTGAALTVDVVYAGPVDFGGYPAGRPYIASGRYLFPAASALPESATEAYSAGVQRAVDGFGWTNETSNPGAVHD